MLVFTRVDESTQSQRLFLQTTDGLNQMAISEDICTQTAETLCGWGAITWSTDERQLAYHQFRRPRPGQPGAAENHIYLATRTGGSATTTLLNGNATSPWWLAGSPFLLLYTSTPATSTMIPHAVDTRNGQRFPLTGEGEEATIHDWRYAPEP
jgi:hypothetical protein